MVQMQRNQPQAKLTISRALLHRCLKCLNMLKFVLRRALKTIIGESFDGDGQARALSALSCAWGLGQQFSMHISAACVLHHTPLSALPHATFVITVAIILSLQQHLTARFFK